MTFAFHFFFGGTCFIKFLFNTFEMCKGVHFFAIGSFHKFLFKWYFYCLKFCLCFNVISCSFALFGDIIFFFFYLSGTYGMNVICLWVFSSVLGGMEF